MAAVPSEFLWFLIAPVVLAVVMIRLSVTVRRANARMRATWVTVEAEITALQPWISTSEGMGCYYSPQYRFHHDGQEYTVVGSQGCSASCYRIGQRMRIRIDPANPIRTRIDDWECTNAAPTTLLIMGLVVLCLCLALVLSVMMP